MAAKKVNITTDDGRLVEATAPIIVSASRSTDIPAFYAEWFFADWKRDTLYGQIHSMECRCIFHIKTLAL